MPNFGIWQPAAGDDNLLRIIEASGQRASRRNNSPAYLDRLARTAEFLADVIEGRRDPYFLREAMSASDFPILMGDILDRQLLGKYAAAKPSWQNYCKRGRVRDFRTVRRVARDGLRGRYYPDYARAELGEAKEDNGASETGYSYAVQVYEKAVALNWKMFVNDDLGAFNDIPNDLAIGATRTEDYFAATLFCDVNGPHASLYTAGNKNIVNAVNAGGGFTAINPPLSIAGVQQGFAVLANQVDASGEPIVIDAVELVVPPALEITGLNILNAVQIYLNEAGGATNQQMVAANWMKSRVRLSVNPYIPFVASAANGSTSWFLFANPDTNRPALEIGFLAGYETPGLFMKAPDTMRVGGAVAPELGDFETGEIRYKGMHIIGGTRLDPKVTVASNGSGA